MRLLKTFRKAVGNVDLVKRADVDIIGGTLARTRKAVIELLFIIIGIKRHIRSYPVSFIRFKA